MEGQIRTSSLRSTDATTTTAAADADADSGDLHLSVSELNENLVCPLCGGYYREAYAISECLHTCKPLLTSSLPSPLTSSLPPSLLVCKLCLFRKLNDRKTMEGYCPTCNVNLGIRPLEKVVKDANLQAIIDILLPQFAEDDLKVKRAYERHKKRIIMNKQLGH